MSSLNHAVEAELSRHPRVLKSFTGLSFRSTTVLRPCSAHSSWQSGPSHALMKSLLTLLGCVALLFSRSTLSAQTRSAVERIVLVGDSTVASKTGWGDALPKLLAPGVECVNMGRGGRSSKSYRAEGHWKKALEE